MLTVVSAYVMHGLSQNLLVQTACTESGPPLPGHGANKQWPTGPKQSSNE